MIVHNRVTNDLKLVEKVDLRGPMHLFMQSFSASTGFTLEVFRDERHLASMTPQNTTRGDLRTLALANQALKINLGPRIMAIHGSLHTQDNFTREYEMELRIHISHPTLFASLYIQHSDPVDLAQKAIIGILASYAQRQLHDDMESAAILQVARNSFSGVTQQRCGIAVDEVRVDLRLGDRHSEVVGLGQDEMVEEARLKKEGRIANVNLDVQGPLQSRRDELELEHQRRLAAHQLQQTALQKQQELLLDELEKQHERKQAIQDVYAQRLSQIIADHLDKGYTLQELWNQYPELRGVLESSIQPQLGGPESVQGLLPRTTIANQGSSSETLPSLPPANTNQTTPAFRPKALRRVSEDESSEVIEMEARQNREFDAVYEPVIKVKQRRTPSDISDVPSSLRPEQSQPSDANAPTIPLAAQPEAHTSTIPTAPIAGTSFHNTHLGVTFSTVMEEERRALQLDEQIVFSVQAIDIGSPAQRASLIHNDYLVEINGQPVIDIQSLLSILGSCSSNGAAVVIRVLRQGQLINLPEITLTR